jgi:hypothetical protein
MSNQLFNGEDERELNHSFNEGLELGRKQGAVEELELDISWLKDLEDYAYLFGHKGEMLNRITMRKEYQNKRLKELKEKGVE